MTSKHTARSIKIGRFLRNSRQAALYPWWRACGRRPPDNHHYKTSRIRKIARAHGCETFIETGTFFGQTLAAVSGDFRLSMSIELSDDLFAANSASFQQDAGIRIFHGDSGSLLGKLISKSEGRVLYWLDGHYSGGVTAHGNETTPILQELRSIAAAGRRDDCILIDDLRLFNGADGYPKEVVVREALLEINPDYRIYADCDCLVAAPHLKLSAESR